MGFFGLFGSDSKSETNYTANYTSDSNNTSLNRSQVLDSVGNLTLNLGEQQSQWLMIAAVGLFAVAGIIMLTRR